MGRYIRWQAILTLTGIAMTLAFLGFLSMSRQTVTIPDVGGVYTEAIAGSPQFINPLLAQFNQVDQDLTALIFNGLTRIDGDGTPQPDLAKSWKISDDGLTYTFKLRNDIKWQDGEPFSADDVLFTIGLMQDPEFPGAPHLGSLWRSVTAEKLDKYTVRFVLSEALPGFMQFTDGGILPKHVLTQMPARDLLNHPFNLQPVGTGPFKLDELNSSFARLSANPLYAGPKPKLGGLEFRFYADFPAMLAAYKNGEVQGISQIPPQSIPDAQKIDSLNLFTGPLSGYTIIYLNLQDAENSPFFQEAAVRRAMLHAIDRQQIIEKTLNGQGLPAVGPILPWSWAFNPAQEIVSFDPALAAQLLDEAGWADSDADGVRDKDGVPLAFSLLSSEDPAKINVALAVARQLQQVGVSATVDVVGAGMGRRLSNHNFQAALAEVLLAGDPDPYPFWHQTQIEAGQNYAGWDNTEASKLLETARALTDRGRRSDYYFEFQRIFAQEVPSLVLFHPVYTYGVSRDIFDVQIAPLIKPSDRFKTVTRWYILTRQIIFREGQYPVISPLPTP